MNKEDSNFKPHRKKDTMNQHHPFFKISNQESFFTGVSD